MGTVGLGSGAVFYVTELGRLVADPTLATDDGGSPLPRTTGELPQLKNAYASVNL